MQNTVKIIVICICIMGIHCKVDDDEDFDPYTTTDPAKREPTPCEGLYSGMAPVDASVPEDANGWVSLQKQLTKADFLCKYFVTELSSRLEKSGKSKEVIETGHGLEKKKRFKYNTSELRLTEALVDPHICENILHYNVHAEREGSLRYAKGMSETFETLHGLVNKGVKVELGMPYELWDKPSAEVTKMHRACFKLAEEYEEAIETWYYHRQDQNLFDYICKQRYLSKMKWDKTCLEETWTGKEKRPELMPGYKGDTEDAEKEEKRKKEMQEVEKAKKKAKSKKNKKGDGGSAETKKNKVEL